MKFSSLSFSLPSIIIGCFFEHLACAGRILNCLETYPHNKVCSQFSLTYVQSSCCCCVEFLSLVSCISAKFSNEGLIWKNLVCDLTSASCETLSEAFRGMPKLRDICLHGLSVVIFNAYLVLYFLFLYRFVCALNDWLHQKNLNNRYIKLSYIELFRILSFHAHTP